MMYRAMILSAFILLGQQASAQDRWQTSAGHAEIHSHTVVEDISAMNDEVSGTLYPETGTVGISVPVQSFRFEKAMMQEHFNSPNFLDSKKYPRITFKGRIVQPGSIDLTRDGEYDVVIRGDLTIREVTKQMESKARILVNGGKIEVTNELLVTDIGAYGIGKPMGSKKDNVANDIQVRYKAIYEKGHD